MSAIAGRVLLIPKGAYDANVTYHMLDVVSYGGNSYVAKQTTAGNTPSADNAYWMLLSAGSAVASINDIGDVLITSPTNGQVLKYNAATQKWENGQDTGGLLPHLIIISEAGEDVVKAVKGSTEIIATETSTGHYECDVPEFGTWTIHAVLNGDDAQVNLVVDTVKVYTVDDSHFHADITVNFPVWEATCNLAGQGESYYATSDPYTFTVHSAGTYTITVVEGSNTYTDTVEVTATGQTFSKVVPAPVDAPLDDINYWLWYGGIDNSEGVYSTLADILADTDALSALTTSQNAVDYMVRNTSWATSVTANNVAMLYIGLNNYCADTLLADDTWMTAICNSTYFESVLNDKIPTMTGETTPSGECFWSNNTRGGTKWGVFSGSDGDWTSGNNSNEGYLGYIFDHIMRPYLITSTIRGSWSTGSFTYTYSYQSSADGTTYNDITSSQTESLHYNYPQNHTHITNNHSPISYFRFHKNAGVSDCPVLNRLQLYGRVDV